MLGRTGAWAGLLVLAAAATVAAGADESNSRDAREREMLRRAQEALRQSQENASELSQAKSAAEQKLKDASQQLDSVRNASKSAESGLRAKLQTAAAAQTDLTQQLERARQQIAALMAQQQDAAKRLSAREADLKQSQQSLEASKAANTSCETKNLQLYQYSEELLGRYQKKGVWAAMSQKEPVFGLKEVGIENVVQEYQEKLDQQKLTPSPAPVPATNTPPAQNPTK
jgi:chromosome segregation ATPase